MEDYKSAHLQWIMDNPKFTPYGLHCVGHDYKTMMWEFYFGNGSFDLTISQEVAKALYDGDRKHQEQTRALLNATTGIKRFIFVTVGFNRDKFDNDRATKFMYKILNAKWALSFHGVIEFHGSSGWRPHCHMLIEHPANLYKSDIINNIYKITQSKSFNGLVVGKNHIEYDTGDPAYHIKYISGEKRDSKVDFVVEDKLYRIEHQIPHIFKK